MRDPYNLTQVDIGKKYTWLVQGGIDKTEDLAEKARIKLTNNISLILAIISLAFGVIYYLVAGRIEFIIATNIEAVFFAFIIYLNHRGHPLWAGVVLQGIVTGAVIYFGVVFGKAIEVYVLAVFLCGGTLAFMKASPARYIFLGVGAMVITAIELNKYYALIESFTFTEQEFSFIKYSSVTVVIILTLFAIGYYVNNNNKLLKELNEQKEHLEDEVDIKTEDLRKVVDAKSIFIRELTHELRTPLNTILSIAQFKIKPDYVEDRTDSVNLYAACYNTLQIVNNTLDRFLLDNNKKPAIARQWININEFGKEMLQAFHYIAVSAEVELELYVAENMPRTVYEIEPYIRQIISNLLGNAIKYTTPGTTVKLHFSLAPAGDKWMVEVIDNGPGIPPEKQHVIFEEYARVGQNAVEGTGVGLANSKSYALLLGGDIEVRSTVNAPGETSGETAFTVSLPVIKFNDGAQPSTIKNYPIATVKFNGLTALLVEDDRMNRALQKRYLEDLGFAIHEAVDGEKGLALAKQYHPDIIVTDVRMPIMNGKELLQHVRADAVIKDTPIIFCTGESGLDLNLELDPLSKCVPKPFSFSVLHRAIQELLLAELVSVK
ncbi:hybrid sensor histidine kinase/response regulator [Chitinophaga niabensis]|uniref:hybrid sensor histidine kinase/response regulator n=1 Tax=Chitinophaga niabensis TaxID=536979 RepID=UPI0031B9E3A0